MSVQSKQEKIEIDSNTFYREKWMGLSSVSVNTLQHALASGTKLSAGGPGEQGWGMTRGRSLRLTPARQTAVQALAESVFSSVKLYQM